MTRDRSHTRPILPSIIFSPSLACSFPLALTHSLTFTLPTRCKISSTFLYLLLDKTYKNAGKSIYREEESYSLRNVVFFKSILLSVIRFRICYSPSFCAYLLVSISKPFLIHVTLSAIVHLQSKDLFSTRLPSHCELSDL